MVGTPLGQGGPVTLDGGQGAKGSKQGWGRGLQAFPGGLGQTEVRVGRELLHELGRKPEEGGHHGWSEGWAGAVLPSGPALRLQRQSRWVTLRAVTHHSRARPYK